MLGQLHLALSPSDSDYQTVRMWHVVTSVCMKLPGMLLLDSQYIHLYPCIPHYIEVMFIEVMII